jgi:hypothetical protein
MVETEIFIGIAHISGIFIGFEALIGAVRKDEVDSSHLVHIRSVVTVGLVSIVAALIPIGFQAYGISGHLLWFLCGLIFFILNLIVLILSMRKTENRKLLATQMREKPLMTVLFWALLEIPLQVPLILIFTGVFPDLEAGFYITSLLFNMFQAAFVLAQLVYSKVNHKKVNTNSESKE